MKNLNEENSMTLLIPPFDEFKNAKIKPLSYLIENNKHDNYYIHRELTEDEKIELEHVQENIIQYQGKWYLAAVSNAPTELSAILAVKSYWEAFKQINDTETSFVRRQH